MQRQPSSFDVLPIRGWEACSLQISDLRAPALVGGCLCPICRAMNPPPQTLRGPGPTPARRCAGDIDHVGVHLGLGPRFPRKRRRAVVRLVNLMET